METVFKPFGLILGESTEEDVIEMVRELGGQIAEVNTLDFEENVMLVGTGLPCVEGISPEDYKPAFTHYFVRTNRLIAIFIRFPISDAYSAFDPFFQALQNYHGLPTHKGDHGQQCSWKDENQLLHLNVKQEEVEVVFLKSGVSFPHWEDSGFDD